MTRASVVLLGVLVAAVSGAADSEGKAAFERLKKLQGTWSGPAGQNGEMKATVIYKVTGGGSAVVETQFPGTDHEMVTVYHLDGDDLLLTHYCAAHNQPRMRWAAGKDPQVLEFVFVSGTNMKPTDPHMHAATHRLLTADHLVSEWTFYADGKKGNVVKFDLKRVVPK